MTYYEKRIMLLDACIKQAILKEKRHVLGLLYSDVVCPCIVDDINSMLSMFVESGDVNAFNIKILFDIDPGTLDIKVDYDRRIKCNMQIMHDKTNENEIVESYTYKNNIFSMIKIMHKN